MRFQTLAEWLAWQETLHPSTIELGLERVNQVFRRMHASHPPFKVITVAGTNGKGSSVALLQQTYLAAGYRVGSYTSPHLLHYNERIRLDGAMVDDATICAAFARVDAARDGISLTYFEFGTLAALDIFYRADLDIAILEVGLGGRLDAVNIIDADVALITSIGLDHQAWLGDDREVIGREKAGIMRGGRAAVCSDPEMPASIAAEALSIGARLYRLHYEFGFTMMPSGWNWRTDVRQLSGLPAPALRGEHQYHNAAGVLMCVQCLQAALPVDTQAIRKALLSTTVTGRFQVIPGEIPVVLDVAHNPAAVRCLRSMLQDFACSGRTLAVFGVYRDKDIGGMVAEVADVITAWYPCSLGGERGTEAAEVRAIIQAHNPTAVVQGEFRSAEEALAAARLAAMAGDRIVIFGSFSTVAEALGKGI